MTDRSPLTEIRSAELAAARSVAAASEEADQRIAAARRRAVELVNDARATGRKSADERHDAALAEARAQAIEIARSVEQRIDDLRISVEPEIDRLVDAMLGIVLPRVE